MSLTTFNSRLKLFGPLFKRGINRKHRKRNKKKVTNHIIPDKQLPKFTALELLQA